jgi:transposase
MRMGILPSLWRLGEALSYAINNRSGLEAYLEHPELTPSNNIAENSFRPFVIGRKNFLFSATTNGASASASMYNLIESVKMQGLIPYHSSFIFLIDSFCLKPTRTMKLLCPGTALRK